MKGRRRLGLRRVDARSRRYGFSLIEITITLGICALLLAFTLPSLGLLNGSRLSASGNLVVDLANQARQVAIAKNSMVALVLATKIQGDDISAYRAFGLVEKSIDSTEWKLISPWQFIPDQLVVDRDASVDFINPTQGTELGPFSIRGHLVEEYSYQVFLPDGSLKCSSGVPPPSIRLVNSFSKGTKARDYYDITFNVHTGIPIVDRLH